MEIFLNEDGKHLTSCQHFLCVLAKCPSVPAVSLKHFSPAAALIMDDIPMPGNMFPGDAQVLIKSKKLGGRKYSEIIGKWHNY